MRFLVDAQLPRRLAHRLKQEGFEVIHTLDLPLRNRTPDSILNDLSVREQYIVVTKDEDFVSSFHLQRRPRKLLLVSTGNIRNTELEALFLASLPEIVAGFQQFDFLEINREAVIFHV
jgi:predicted nuclease of predicted toxin-antitoxin system